jgi:hypothetical protein
MTIPSGIPLVGGASPWVVLGPVTALSVAAGVVMAEIDRRLSVRATVSALARPVEKVLRKAA